MAYAPGDPRRAAASRRYYEKNKKKYLEYSRRSQEKYRSLVRAQKDKPCADCGIRYPYYVMDFDHRPDEVKEFGIATIHFFKSMERLTKEIAKCDVVCSNCHRERTQRRKLAASLKTSAEAGTSSLTQGRAKTVPSVDQPGA